MAQGLKIRTPAPLDFSANSHQEIARLAKTLDRLNEAAETQLEGRPVTLIIDEFSSLLARYGETAEGQLRAVVQTHQNVGYIFAGSNVQLMLDMTSRHSRPFYHGGDTLYLRSVPEDEFSLWIGNQFRNSGFNVAGVEPVWRILALADNVPCNVQLLAHDCWNTLRSQGQPDLTVDLVNSVFKTAIQHLTPSFKQKWFHLTPLRRSVLAAVVHAEGKMLKSMEIARSIQRPESSTRSALHALYNHGILWNDWGNLTVQVRLADPFFGHWVGTLE